MAEVNYLNSVNERVTFSQETIYLVITAHVIAFFGVIQVDFIK